MEITATQVLEMLSKAKQLSIRYDVYDAEEYLSIHYDVAEEYGYFIQFEVNWFSDEYKDYSYEKVFINNSNESVGYGGWDFLTWMNMLDEKLEQKKQEKIKAEKRKEVLAKLTDEERELLGLGVSSQSVPHKSQMPF
jgi:hypothetical protein